MTSINQTETHVWWRRFICRSKAETDLTCRRTRQQILIHCSKWTTAEQGSIHLKRVKTNRPQSNSNMAKKTYNNKITYRIKFGYFLNQEQVKHLVLLKVNLQKSDSIIQKNTGRIKGNKIKNLKQGMLANQFSKKREKLFFLGKKNVFCEL